MNNLQELLQQSPKQVSPEGHTLKAISSDLNCDPETGKIKLVAEFDANDIIRNGAQTKSGRERFANCTIRIPRMPIRFTGNLFIKIA